MRLLFSVIAACIALSGCASVLPPSGTNHVHDSGGQFSALALHIAGSHLAGTDGRPVELQGINIGGWLIIEDWMCGITDEKDTEEANGKKGISGRSALESLTERFGSQRAAALLSTWEDNWITGRDLDLLRDAGFNLVRVPFSYRTLQNADGSWILDARGQIDFSRMDWIVRSAAQRGIRTIFDLHDWPQQRNDQDKIGRPDGQKIRDSMAALWTAVAAHYRGNGAIAGFDLINEFPGNWGVQQVFSHAVSNADPGRIQVIEGFTYLEFQKLHADGVFPNSIFSEHLYGDEPLTTEEIKSRLNETAGSSVPIYVGEFLAENFSSATLFMDSSGISWSAWTYKAVDMGNWAIFNYYSTVKTDIEHDTFEEISTRWGNDFTAWQAPRATKNYSLNEGRSPAFVSPAT